MTTQRAKADRTSKAHVSRRRSQGIGPWCVAGAAVIAAALAGCGSGSNGTDQDATVAPATPKPPSASASVAVTLTGSDTETCELIFETANPVNGTLSENTDEPCEPGSPNRDSATVTFTSEPGVCGPATGSFTYTTNDGLATSAPATVTVDIPCIEVGAEE
jgi:hypothetical protein